MFGLGVTELLIILAIVLLFFGAKRLPGLTKNLRKSSDELKDSFTGGKNDKSLKDIAKEVGDSAREIRHGVDSVKEVDPVKDTQV